MNGPLRLALLLQEFNENINNLFEDGASIEEETSLNVKYGNGGDGCCNHWILYSFAEKTHKNWIVYETKTIFEAKNVNKI